MVLELNYNLSDWDTIIKKFPNLKFIEKIFNSVESLNYDNFEWHITDDYSTDNTKNSVLERLEKSSLKHHR